MREKETEISLRSIQLSWKQAVHRNRERFTRKRSLKYMEKKLLRETILKRKEFERDRASFLSGLDRCLQSSWGERER